MSTPVLYGVGVGPGAPDLVTFRAVATLRAAPVLAIPRSCDWGASTAWKIVRSHLTDVEGQERIRLTFPMSTDPERVRAACDRAVDAIGQRLEWGLSVAFVTEGDPVLFSTFVYLAREIPRRWPHVGMEVVPGVSSVTAVPATVHAALADGQERMAVIPAAYGVDDLDELFGRFDTVVLMKIGPRMPEVLDSLQRCGLTEKAVYVSKATMAEQTIVEDVRTLRETRGDCFGMMVVRRGERSGMLVGDSPQCALENGREVERDDRNSAAE